jgi:hypothetical protein
MSAVQGTAAARPRASGSIPGLGYIEARRKAGFIILAEGTRDTRVRYSAFFTMIAATATHTRMKITAKVQFFLKESGSASALRLASS